MKKVMKQVKQGIIKIKEKVYLMKIYHKMGEGRLLKLRLIKIG